MYCMYKTQWRSWECSELRRRASRERGQLRTSKGQISHITFIPPKGEIATGGTVHPSHSAADKSGRPPSSAAEPSAAADLGGIPNEAKRRPKVRKSGSSLKTLESKISFWGGAGLWEYQAPQDDFFITKFEVIQIWAVHIYFHFSFIFLWKFLRKLMKFAWVC